MKTSSAKKCFLNLLMRVSGHINIQASSLYNHQQLPNASTAADGVGLQAAFSLLNMAYFTGEAVIAWTFDGDFK